MRAAGAAGALAAGIVLAGGCGEERSADPAGETPAAIGPVRPPATADAELPAPALTTDTVENEPWAPLQSGEELLWLMAGNLDGDEGDEQLVLVRAEVEGNPVIKLIVVDAAGPGSPHRRTWEAATRATDPRTFNVQVQDVTGDHQLEIVARGINASDQRTLDVYRQAPAGPQLAFVSILSVAAEGAIEIQDRTPGVPFPIVVQATDPQGSEVTDLLRTAYEWRAQDERYHALPTERIPGAVVEERQLRELFGSRGTAAFEEFLAGPWYRMIEPGQGRPAGGTEVIHFEPEQRRITLFDGDVQEIYTWDVSHRLLSSRLGIWVRNELVDSIQKTINVEVNSLRAIRVVIKGRESGDYADHHYEQLTTSRQVELTRSAGVDPRPLDLPLSGVYRAADHDQTIIFEPPRFTWLNGTDSASGGYGLYSVGQPVIVFKIMSPAGVTRELRTYVVEYDEHRIGDRLFRSLLLRSATLEVTGVVATAATGLRFEQVEIVQEETAADDAGAIVVVTPDDQAGAEPRAGSAD